MAQTVLKEICSVLVVLLDPLLRVSWYRKVIVSTGQVFQIHGTSRIKM